MILAIDFDGTIVGSPHRFDDLDAPLLFLPGARRGLLALRAAGHMLLLWSARANRALLYDPSLDPLVRAGRRAVDLVQWEKSHRLHWARFWQMVEFVDRELPGVFGAIDDGRAGKPIADLFITEQSLRISRSVPGNSWQGIAHTYGGTR